MDLLFLDPPLGAGGQVADGGEAVAAAGALELVQGVAELLDALSAEQVFHRRDAGGQAADEGLQQPGEPRLVRHACSSAARREVGRRRNGPARRRRGGGGGRCGFLPDGLPRVDSARARPEVPGDAVQQLRPRDRLGEVVGAAGLEALDAVLGHRVGGQRDDRHAARRPRAACAVAP